MPKEWSKKLREDIIPLYKQGAGYKQIAIALAMDQLPYGSAVCLEDMLKRS